VVGTIESVTLVDSGGGRKSATKPQRLSSAPPLKNLKRRYPFLYSSICSLRGRQLLFPDPKSGHRYKLRRAKKIFELVKNRFDRAFFEKLKSKCKVQMSFRQSLKGLCPASGCIYF